MSTEPRELAVAAKMRNVSRKYIGLAHVVDLPDAEHIHVHRHADGTITAVPMRQIKGDVWVQAPLTRGAIIQTAPVWRDVEGGGA